MRMCALILSWSILAPAAWAAPPDEAKPKAEEAKPGTEETKPGAEEPNAEEAAPKAPERTEEASAPAAKPDVTEEASAPVASPDPAPAKEDAGAVTTPPDAPASLSERRDQGVAYFRKGMLEPALVELRAAAKMKGGADDYEVHLYLARANHALHRIGEAHLEAERAVDLADTPERKQAAQEFLQGLRKFYGEVTFLSAGPDAGPRRGFLAIETTTPFIATEKKRAFAKARESYKSEVTTLPQSVFLPGGEFTANGVPFNVVEGDTTEVFLGLQSSATAGRFPWIWVASGTAAALVAGVAAWALIPEPVPKRTVQVEGTFR